ncbi:MAG TPA: cytochrome c [Pyrinomonadaceae bacterium]|jgi:mono/diheme cytochrome c family protein
MKHLKTALLSSAFALLALACTGNNTTTNNSGDISRANTASSPAASATPSPTPTPDEFAAARTTYNAVCIRCHKDNGEGGLVELDEKTKLKVPSLKEGHGLTHTDQQFARQIAQGGDGMPAFKNRLSPEQIDELVRFIRREFQVGLVKPTASPAH